MGFLVDYEQMRSLLGSYSGIISGWGDSLESVISTKSVIEKSDNIGGNKADHMREYLNNVYSVAEGILSLLFATFQQNFILYVNDYYAQVDSSGDARIPQEELEMRYSDLLLRKSTFQLYGTSAESSISTITDLMTVPSCDMSDLDAQFQQILNYIDTVNTSVADLESAHRTADFDDIDSLVTRAKAFFKEMISCSETYKTDFSIERFATLSSVPALLTTMQDAVDHLQGRESDVKQAVENLEKIEAIEQEKIEKRKEQAKWIKVGGHIVLGTITAVVTVAATATFGPAGTIVAGSICGAVSSAFDATVDEYAEHGWYFKDWDMNKIKFKAGIGAITGMINSLVPPGAGLVVKSSIKGLSSAVSGMSDTAYDQWSTHGKINDISAIVETAVLRGGSSFVGNLVGGAVSEGVEGLIKKSDTIEKYAEHVVGGWGHFSAVAAVEVPSEIASGYVKRIVTTGVEETGGYLIDVASGKSSEEAYADHNILEKIKEKAIDYSEIVEDAGSAIGSAVTDDPLTKSYAKLKTRQDDYYHYGDSPDLHGPIKSRVGWLGWKYDEHDAINESLKKLDKRSPEEARRYAIYGDAPDLNGNSEAWLYWDSEGHDAVNESLRKFDERSPEEAREYAIYGPSGSIESQRQMARKEAFADERRLVMQGRGTRNWTVSQQEELIRTGKVSGFDGSHMFDVSHNLSAADKPDNIQFLTYEEHIYGAHDSNPRNETKGRFDPSTGKTTVIDSPGQLPHRYEAAFELTDKYDPRQLDVTKDLGPDFGYGRGKKDK